MKKIYFILLFGGIFSAANAQIPIITQANYPGGWEDYPAMVNLAVPAMSPGPNGPNQTWDFSSMTGFTAITFHYPWISETPYNTQFASSDLALGPVLGQYSFFNSTSSEFEISGTVTNFGTEYIRPYVDAQTIVTFPFTYADSFKDTARTANYPFTSGGADHQQRTIYSETIADAYGDLTVPNATVPAGTTYNNVLRLRITSKTIDSNFNSSNAFLSEDISIDTNYYWVSPDFKPHVFVLTKSVQNTTSIGAQYFTALAWPTGNKNAYESYFSIYPNPLSTELVIEVDQNIFNSNTSISINLLNSNGIEVMQSKMLSNKTIIPRNGLASGIYFYRISSKDKTLSSGKISIH